MSKAPGYIIVGADGVPIDDPFGFGATTFFTDWHAAAAQAKLISDGAQLRPLIPAKTSTDTPRRGRPRKNQEES